MSRLRRPLVAALLFFLAGLLAVFRFPNLALSPSAAIPVAGVTLAIAIGARTAWIVRLAPFALLGLAGLMVGSQATADIAADCRRELHRGQRLDITLTLLSGHRPDPVANPLLPGRFDGPRHCSGTVRVRLPHGTGPVPLGARVQVAGEWTPFDIPSRASRAPVKPGSDGFVRVDSLRVLDHAPHGLLALRSSFDERIGATFPDHRPVIEALVLGRKEYLDRSLRDRFTASGLAHLLAISGMHVGLLASLLLIGGSLLRLPSDLRAWLTIGSIWIYLAMIGAPPSALRAGIMLSLAMLGRLIQRPAAAEAGIAAAAILILVFDPLAVLDPGFQLSFAGVLGILLLRGPVLTALAFGPADGNALRWLRDALSVSVAAFAVTTPIALHHFGTFAPISIVAGIPAVPLMSLALAGVVLAMLLAPLEPAARLVADGATLLLDLLVWIADTAASLPLSHFTLDAPPPGFWSISLGAFLVYRFLMRGSRPLRRNGIALAGTAAAMAFLPAPALLPGGDLEIHFLDVGQGDATAIRTPAGRWVLVDAGPRSADYDAGERRVVPFLHQRGSRSLDALIVTHPDLDHIGGAPAVIRALDVDHLFDPGAVFGRTPYLELIEAAEDRGVDWRAARSGRTLVVDQVRFEMLAPIPKTIDASADANQISAVVLVRFGEFELLLTGDADASIEADLIRRFPGRLQADVLKLGHHGSSTSSSAEFLDQVGPQLAVVSAGSRNRYGHPAVDVLARVRERGIGLARTDTEGTVTIVVAPGGLSWKREGW